MSQSFRLIRSIASKLKYAPLDLLRQYPLTIHSFVTLESDIRQELGKIIPSGCRLLTRSDTLYGMLEKYQFLDLTAQVPEALLLESNYQSGVPLLRQLLPRTEPEAWMNSDEDDELIDFNFVDTFLKNLVRDLNTGSTICRILIESRSPQTEEKQAKQRSNSHGLPEDFFPHQFVIRDACLTNAESVWFFKHFYL